MMKHQQGMTILEIMLVLVIVSILILMGIRQYQNYLLDRDVAQTKYNVNVLFEGLKKYYQRHCRGLYSSTHDNYDGNLNPLNTSAQKANFALDITRDLVKANFLEPWSPKVTSIVGNNTYITQFNYGPLSNPQMNVCWNFTGKDEGKQCVAGALPSKALLWRAQVAILLSANIAKTKADADKYQRLLGADCVSTLNNKMVTPCSQNPSVTKDFYLVWERLPSFATQETTSPLWLSTPRLQQFNRQYTNDTYYEYTNPTYGQGQYYLCGG